MEKSESILPTDLGRAIRKQRLRASLAVLQAALSVLWFSPHAVAAGDSLGGEVPHQAVEQGVSDDIRALALAQEQEWRRVFEAEIDKPIIDKAQLTIMTMPNVVEGLAVGMAEEDLRGARPSASDNDALMPALIRQLFPFVPGMLHEDSPSPEWHRATYHLRHRRLVGVHLTSSPLGTAEADNLLARLVRDVSPALLMSSQEMVRNSADSAHIEFTTLLWTNDQHFVALTRRRGQESTSDAVSCTFGSASYWPDLRPVSDLRDASDEESEELFRGLYPLAGADSAGEHVSDQEAR